MTKYTPAVANHGKLPEMRRLASKGEVVIIEPVYDGNSHQLVEVPRGWHFEPDPHSPTSRLVLVADD